jgi:hypothetical protein
LAILLKISSLGKESIIIEKDSLLPKPDLKKEKQSLNLASSL